ncbi:MAG TPA: cytochrome c/FTR1 family iron permease [Gemmatimonadales bacterium]
MDSVSVARRIVAAAQLAAKEYALGVLTQGGRVTDPEEVKEAGLFLQQARLDVHALPAATRADADSALAAMAALVDRTAAPEQVSELAEALAGRLARSSGALFPVPLVVPSLARGAEVFREHCATCHGETGRGDGPGARGLTPPPANLADPQVMGAKSRLDLYRQLLLGVPGTAMPTFERTLSEDDRWAVAAYALTLQYGGSQAAAIMAAVRRGLDSAVSQRSDRLAFDAYLTFEGVETDVRAHDPGLATRLEGEFARLRSRAAAGASPAELQTLQRELLGDLEHAERLLVDRASGANLFLQSLMLLVREGFEAILIIAALMSFLTKAGAPTRRREVALGAWAAVVASGLTAVLFELLLKVPPVRRSALEGFTMLAAVAVLFYVSYWLLSKIEADKWSAFLKGKMQAALSSGSALALASVAFLAVYREGVETILFYKALLASGGPGDAGAVIAGVALGAGCLVLLYVLLMRLGVRIPMKAFFAVTGALLYYMAFVFAGKGIAELQEAGIVGTTVLPSLEWLRVPLLGIYPTVQSLAPQGLLLLLLLIALVARMLRVKPSAVSREPPAVSRQQGS